MAFIIVLVVLFFGGLWLITEIQKHDPTGCTSAITSCAYGAVKGNGLALDLNNPFNAAITIFLGICIVILAVFVANMIYDAIHNRPANTEAYRMNTEKQPNWIDDRGEASALMTLFLAIPVFLILWFAFGSIIEALNNRFNKPENTQLGVLSRGNRQGQGYFRRLKNW